MSRAKSMWSESRNLSGVWPMKYSSCVLSFLSTMATLRPSAMISNRGGSVILESHPAGTGHAQLSLGAPSVRSDLNEVGAHDAGRVEPGVGARNRFVGRDRRRRGGLRRFGGLLRRRERAQSDRAALAARRRPRPRQWRAKG